MIFDPKIFYQTYLDDYHKIKASVLSKILEDLSKYEVDFFGYELDAEGRGAFEKTLKSDLRQTYFHSIETFFEIFFTLNPKGKTHFDDVNILINLTNSDWRKSYNKIEEIASENKALDFLDEMIEFNNQKVSIGHYLFYFGTFGWENSKPGFMDKLNESIDAIKFGIRIIAKDFVDRDEYNSYKHGLRLIPVAAEIAFGEPDTFEKIVSWDLKDSMSFYGKTKSKDEVKIITKLFDSKRDCQMIIFCSNMISNMIFFRNIALNKESVIKKMDKVGIPFFGKKEIEECDNINVKIQNLIYTIKRV